MKGWPSPFLLATLAIAEKSDRELLVHAWPAITEFKVVEHEAKDHPEKLSVPYPWEGSPPLRP